MTTDLCLSDDSDCQGYDLCACAESFDCDAAVRGARSDHHDCDCHAGEMAATITERADRSQADSPGSSVGCSSCLKN